MPSGDQGAGGGVMPRISLIAAMAGNRVIGIANKLPWKLPADMQWFRKQTLGKPIIMGRKTFESFGAKPLPGRTNIIVTSDVNYRAEGCVVAHSIDAALHAAGEVPEIMIIGGASFYEQMLPRADRIYLTLVHSTFVGDSRFPEFYGTEFRLEWRRTGKQKGWYLPLGPTQWKEVQRIDHKKDKKNPYAYSFLILDRV